MSVHLPSLQQQVVACFAFLACFTGVPAAITDAHAKAMATMLKLIFFILIFLLNVYDKILAIHRRIADGFKRKLLAAASRGRGIQINRPFYKE